MIPPVPNTYWVTAKLLAGKYPGSTVEAEARSKVQALVDAGVRTFIDLTEDGELFAYAHLLAPDVVHERIAVQDVTSPSREQIRQALDLIERGSRNGVVYLHCRGGCGRTGVVLGCYLVEQGLSADDALARVGELSRSLWRKPCPETLDQIERVRRWSAHPSIASN